MKKGLFLIIALLMILVMVGCGRSTDISGPDAFRDYDELASYLREMNEDDASFGINAYPEAGTDTTTDRSSDDYSKSNDQVEGVNEADRVLTDGTYIYVSAYQAVHIVNAADLSIVYTKDYENAHIQGLYLQDDRLVVIVNTYTAMDNDDADPRQDDSVYDYYWWRSDNTHVDIFDVSSTDDVILDRSLVFPRHRLFDSRMIGGRLFLMMNRYLSAADLDNDTFLPTYRDSLVGDEEIRLDPGDVHKIPAADYLHYLVLADVDVTDDADPNIKAYLGSASEVYMSTSNLYVTVPTWTYDESEETYDRYTALLRFSVEDEGLIYQAQGNIDGHPLNQFSMDEHDGVFRIATSEWLYEDDDYANRVYLLDATTNETMEELSVLEDIGEPGERIYAVRFKAGFAYVVTFEQVDPMYKLDLSDPGNPEILGELHEEGVSDYLHDITDDLMVGVGRTAETVDGVTRFTGVKIALYDTTGNDPASLDTFIVEGQYSYTPVVYDHKAFVYFERPAENKTYIAVPVVTYGNYWDDYSQGIYVFEINYDGTMDLLAHVSHETETYYDSIDRSLFIGGEFYTVSRRQVRQYVIDDGFTHTDTVVFPDDDTENEK